MLSSKKKQTLIKKTRVHEKDTGSSAIQIALLNEQINELTKHLKKHQKDQSSRRGLLSLVAKRRAHERYLAVKAAKKNKKKQ